MIGFYEDMSFAPDDPQKENLMSISNDPTAGDTGSGTPEGVADAGRQVKDDVRNLGSEIGSLAAAKAGQAKEAAQEYLHAGKQRAQEYLDTGKEKAHEYYDLSKSKAQEWEKTVEEYIREKPIQSVLIAAGVGAALGLLLRSRS